MAAIICVCILVIIVLVVSSVMDSNYKHLGKKVDGLENKLLDLEREVFDLKITASTVFEKEKKRRNALEEYLQIDYEPLNFTPAKYVKSRNNKSKNNGMDNNINIKKYDKDDK